MIIARRPALTLTIALMLIGARANATGLIAVLPLDVTHAKGKLDADAQATIEEMLRDVTVDEIGDLGWTVLTGETTIQVLRDNGIDPSHCGGEDCALASAREIKADRFITGSVQYDGEDLTASIRLIDTKTGRITATERLEGTTPREPRKQFEKKVVEFFTRGGLLGAPPPAATPPPAAVAPPPPPKAVQPLVAVKPPAPPAKTAPLPLPPLPPPAIDSSGSSPVAAWVFLGIAGASAIGAGVAGLMAKQCPTTVDNPTVISTAQRCQATDAIISDIAWGVAGASAATSGILLLTWRPSTAQEQAERRVTLHVAPSSLALRATF